MAVCALWVRLSVPVARPLLVVRCCPRQHLASRLLLYLGLSVLPLLLVLVSAGDVCLRY